MRVGLHECRGLITTPETGPMPPMILLRCMTKPSPLYGKGDTIDATVQYYLRTAQPRPSTPWFSPLYGAGWAGGLTSRTAACHRTQPEFGSTGTHTPNGTSPVPNTNGEGNCPTGQTRVPTAGCNVLVRTDCYLRDNRKSLEQRIHAQLRFNPLRGPHVQRNHQHRLQLRQR